MLLTTKDIESSSLFLIVVGDKNKLDEIIVLKKPPIISANYGTWVFVFVKQFSKNYSKMFAHNFQKKKRVSQLEKLSILNLMTLMSNRSWHYMLINLIIKIITFFVRTFSVKPN